jgi:hypothetical protein
MQRNASARGQGIAPGDSGKLSVRTMPPAELPRPSEKCPGDGAGANAERVAAKLAG